MNRPLLATTAATALAALYLAALASCTGVMAAPAPAASQANAMRLAIAKVKPSLVRIHVVGADYREGKELKAESSGSGVIITPDGHIVTNHHVAGDAKRLIVTLASKEQVPALLVGTDPLADIAVIKLLPAKARKFPAATFGDSSAVKVGDPVLAMGSPLSLSQSVTSGVISNTEMVMPEMMWPFNQLKLSGEDVGSMVRWLGHDARIAGGNSGGPLVNLSGQVIGINEIEIGLSGAIPSNLARSVAMQIIKNGKVTRAWLGLEVQPLLKTSPRQQGVLVADVVEGSPAAAAGIKEADIITTIGSASVTVRFAEEVPLFNQMVASLGVGRDVPVVLERGGKQIRVTVRPADREQALPQQAELREWGLTARNLSRMMALEIRRASREGAYITSVARGGPASDARPPLQEGDIIVSLDGKPVANLAALKQLTESQVEGKKVRVPVVAEFDRKTERYLTVVRIGSDPLQDPGLEAAKAWVSVGTQVLTREMAEALEIPDVTGVRITEVYKGHQAEKAGLKVGDIITAIDAQKVEASQTQDVEVFPAMVRQLPIGQEAELSILRDGKPLTLKVTLEASPKLPREMKRYRNDLFEFTVRNVTFSDQDRTHQAEAVKGVAVESVEEGGWAAVGRLAVGDIIQEIEGKPVSNVAEVESIMKELAEKRPAGVVFKVRRGVTGLFVEIQPSWPAQTVGGKQK